MTRRRGRLGSWIADESGPTAVEYAVMLGLIITVCIIAIVSVGSPTSTGFQRVIDANAFGS